MMVKLVGYIKIDSGKWIAKIMIGPSKTYRFDEKSLTNRINTVTQYGGRPVVENKALEELARRNGPPERDPKSEDRVDRVHRG